MSTPDNSFKDTVQPPDIYKKAVRGGLWVFAIRLFIQIISLGKKVVLLRLLMPADFGLLAIAMLIIGLMNRFTGTDFNAALIQRKKADDYLDVAWTVGLVRALILFLVIFTIAPFATNFFDSSKPFSHHDISKPEVLADTLIERGDSFVAYIGDNLSAEARSCLREYKISDSVNPKFPEIIVNDFNQIVRGNFLYTPSRFSGVELTNYAKEVVSDPVMEEDVFRANKLLFQEAFVSAINTTVIDRPECTKIIRLMSLMILFAGFGNIGVIYFTKELDFRRKFYLNVSCTFISAAATILFVFFYRNVTSLAVGLLLGEAIRVGLTYLMHQYRPRIHFDIAKFLELWKFSKHLVANNILFFLNRNGDDILLGKMLGVSMLGFYRQAYDVGNTLTTNMGDRFSEVTFPVYAKLQDNKDKVRAGYLKTLRLLTLATFPFTGVLLILAPEIVFNIIGEKWMMMVPAVRVLCLLGLFRCMQRGPVYMAMGRSELISRVSLVRFIIIAVTVYPLTRLYGMLGTSTSVVISVLLCEPIEYYQFKKLIGVSAKSVMRIVVFPLVATLVMAGCPMAMKIYMDNIGLLELAAILSASGVAYAIALLAGRLFGQDYDVIKLFKEVRKGF